MFGRTGFIFFKVFSLFLCVLKKEGRCSCKFLMVLKLYIVFLSAWRYNTK